MENDPVVHRIESWEFRYRCFFVTDPPCHEKLWFHHQLQFVLRAGPRSRLSCGKHPGRFYRPSYHCGAIAPWGLEIRPCLPNFLVQSTCCRRAIFWARHLHLPSESFHQMPKATPSSIEDEHKIARQLLGRYRIKNGKYECRTSYIPQPRIFWKNNELWLLPFLPCQEFHKRRIRYIVQIHPIDVWKFSAQLGQERIQVNGGLGHGSLFQSDRKHDEQKIILCVWLWKTREKEWDEMWSVFYPFYGHGKENNNGRFAKK